MQRLGKSPVKKRRGESDETPFNGGGRPDRAANPGVVNDMSLTLAFLQARMGSTRLPGKVLLPLGDGTVLENVVRRVQRARTLRGGMKTSLRRCRSSWKTPCFTC